MLMNIKKQILGKVKELSRPLTIAFIYLLFGSLWIMITDRITLKYAHTIDLIEIFQYYKGQFFIIVTTILLFVIVYYDTKHVKQTLEKLESSEEKYRKLFDEAMDMIIVTDADSGIILDCNKQTEIVTGKSKKDLVGIPEKDLYPISEHVGRFSKPYHELLYNDITKRYESKVVNSEGEIVDVSIKASEIKINQRKLLQCVLRDISERKISEQKLIISESRFREIFENMSSAVSIYKKCIDNDEFILVDMNSEAERISKHSKNEFLNKEVSKFLPEWKEAGVIQILLRVWETGKAEYHPVLRIGEEYDSKYFENYTAKLPNNEVVAIYHDITERIEAEKQKTEYINQRNLLLKEKQLQFDSMPLGLLITDKEYLIREVNPAAEKIFGYTKENILFNSFDLFFNDDDKFILNDVIGGIKKRDSLTKHIFENEKKSKEKIVCEWHITSLKDEDDNFIGLLVMIRDITEEKIREAEIRKLSVVVEQSPSVVVVTNKNAEITYVNKRFTEITGYLPQEVLGKNPRILQSGKMKKNEYIYMWQTITSGGIWTGNFLNKKKNGELFWESAKISSIKNEKGEIQNYIAVKEDITKIKAIQDSLEESEIRYRTMFEFSSAIMLLIDPRDGRIWDANQTAENYYGYSQENLRRMIITDINISISSNKLESFLTIIKSGVKKQFYFKHKLANGNVRDVEVYSSIIFLKGKELLFSIIHDITERKKAEEELENYKHHLEDLVEERTLELQQSEERFRTIAQNSRDSLIRFNENLQMIYVNPVIKERLGYEPESLIGKKINEVGLSNELSENLIEKVRSIFITKEEGRIEFELPNKKWIDWLLLPEYGINGEVESVIVFGRDITQHKKLEEKIIQALEKEREWNELKNNFISMASHEFRTPLAAVLSSAELLQRYGKKWDEIKYNEHIVRIRDSVDYLTKLMDDILNVSRIESRKIEFNPTLLELEPLCNSLIENTFYSYSWHGEKEIEIRLSHQLYYLDEKLFRFILTNILSNAVKYSLSNKKIFVKIYEIENNLVIFVQDQGIGIPEEDLKLLFEPFHRAENVKDVQGTGLGMYIIKKSVELHNGDIKVESILGSGTIVTVKLPITKSLN